MSVVQWAFAGLFGTLGILLFAANILYTIMTLRTHRHYSLVPFVGGILLGVGALIAPIEPFTYRIFGAIGALLADIALWITLQLVIPTTDDT
ncbi:MAG: hypothetical protein DHS20C14_10110 [Phycisphaeraceae bacterium]|nr:MAG: hypothetical protein DHS20C14_10110 [Phycisphaeraceae bacterium]